MAWQDRFREGSFRGVPFKTETSETKGGRRKEEHEFAKREIGNTEDLGKKLKSFTLELLVIGDDYFTTRDALEAALEQEGPGELIHPYQGNKQVQVGTYSIKEDVTEGRIARFTVEFVESGQVKFPDQFEDDLQNSVDNAGIVKENSSSFFEDVFSVANQPAFVLDAANDKLEAILDFADNAVKQVTDPVTNFTFAIRELKANAEALIRAPGELAARLQAAFDGLVAEFEDTPDVSRRIFGGFRDIQDEPDFVPVVGDTPSRNQEQVNQDALLNLTKNLTLSNEAESAAAVEFTSNQESITARDLIIDSLDGQLDTAGDDDLFQSIKDLQTSLTRALPTIGTSDLLEIEIKQTIPVLVVAYDQFESLDKEQEIIDQNEVEHPGFIPGGSTISVSAG